MAVKNTLSKCNKEGTEFTLYYNRGTVAVPVWVEHIGMTGDLNIGETDDELELPLRSRSRKVKEYAGGRTDVSITGEQSIDADYEGYQFIRAMRASGNPGDILVLTGPITSVGETGWRGKFTSFDRSKSGPNQGPAIETVSLKPAACTDSPVVPVNVTSSGVIAEYDPTVFTPYS